MIYIWTTTVIVLPKDSLKIQYFDILSIEYFDAKLELKKDITKNVFATNTVSMVVGIAKILPLPEFLSYYDFNEDIPPHIVY